MRRLLLTGRWIGFTVLAVLVAAGCVRTGMWQLDRAEQRSARNTAIDTRADLAPVRVDTVLAVGQRPPDAAEWRPVAATGQYDAAGTLLVRNRTLDGQPGYQVLVPLVRDDGTALVVDRGWVPRTGGAVDAVDVPAPPDGRVRITGRVRPGEQLDPGDSIGRSEQPQPSISRIDVGRLAAESPYPLLGGYVELLTETPPAARALTPLPRPDTENPAVNYSYAFQWFLFAGVALVGWYLLLRREAQGGEPRPGPQRVLAGTGGGA